MQAEVRGVHGHRERDGEQVSLDLIVNALLLGSNIAQRESLAKYLE